MERHNGNERHRIGAPNSALGAFLIFVHLRNSVSDGGRKCGARTFLSAAMFECSPASDSQPNSAKAFASDRNVHAPSAVTPYTKNPFSVSFCAPS